MSFCSIVKKEVVEARKIKKQSYSQNIACVYGFVCFGRYFDKKGYILHTENEFVANYIQSLLSEFNINGEVIKIGGSFPREIFEFCVKQSSEIDRLFSLLKQDKNTVNLRVQAELSSDEHFFSSFICGAFLAAGSIQDPKKSYRLELITSRNHLAADCALLFEQQEFTPKLTKRNNINVLYLTNSEQVEDVLTMIGATTATLQIMNQKVFNNIKNRVQRQTNYELANTDKTVNASVSTIQCIKKLISNGLFQTLDKPLQQTATARLENPEATLAELSINLNISKSGLHHRLAKIIELSKN